MRFLTMRTRTFVLLIIALALTCYWGRELLVWLNYSDRVRIWFVRTVAVLGLLALAYVCFKRVSRGRYHIATLVFGLPTIVAVALFPLPYFTHAQSVRMELARAGVEYRIEATDLEARLNWFARAFLGEGNSQLFSSRIVSVWLDLETFDSAELKSMTAILNAQFVRMVMPPDTEEISTELIDWLDTLPSHCKVWLVLTSIPKLDPAVISLFQRKIDMLSICTLSLSADQLQVFVQASIPLYQFYSVVFLGEKWDTIMAGSSGESLHFENCQVRPDQVLAIASRLKCKRLYLSQLSLKPAIVWAEEDIQKIRELQHTTSVEIAP